MARDKSKQPESDSPQGPGAWIVTFSDCMMLLLCFFVMLVCFSSFEDVPLRQLSGAFDQKSLNSIALKRRTPRESVVPPKERQMDYTEEGSDQPTQSPRENVKNPRESVVITDTDAYRGRKVFHIPSRRLFWGNGTSFTAGGREHLKMITSFVKMVPCHVVIGEVPGLAERGSDRRTIIKRGLDRSWSMLRHLMHVGGLPAGRLRIAAAHGAAPKRFGGQPVMRITLLARNIHE